MQEKINYKSTKNKTAKIEKAVGFLENHKFS